MCGVLFINSKRNNLNKKLCLEAFKTLESRGPDKQFYEFLNKKNFFKFDNPYGIAGSSKKIVKILENLNYNSLLKKSFYDMPNKN